MTQDPILRVFSIWGQRTGIFILASALASMIVWGWCMTEMSVEIANWFSVLSSSFDFASHPVQTLILRGCIAIGFLFSAVVYLLIALWWSGRTQVRHQRGGRFEDHRDGGAQ